MQFDMGSSKLWVLIFYIISHIFSTTRQRVDRIINHLFSLCNLLCFRIRIQKKKSDPSVHLVRVADQITREKRLLNHTHAKKQTQLIYLFLFIIIIIIFYLLLFGGEHQQQCSGLISDTSFRDLMGGLRIIQNHSINSLSRPHAKVYTVSPHHTFLNEVSLLA